MNITRKNFLINSGRFAFASSLLAVGCSGIVRRDLTLNNKKLNSSFPLTETECEILRLASLAPSGHNTQPWTVKIIEPGKWIIGADSGRRLPGVDPDNRELLLSIGAFLENLHLAAGSFGYRAEQKVLAKRTSDRDLVSITLRKDRPVSFPFEKITLRKTIRNGHLNQPLSESDIKLLTSSRESFHFYPAASREGRMLAEGTIEANVIQAGRKSAVKELSEWIRFSDKDARKYRNGLTPESMEIHGISGFVVRNFFNSDSVMSSGFKDKTVEGVKKQVASCGGWIVITSEDSKVKTLIDTGRAFQRMCLETRGRNIAVHPMTQILEEIPFRDETAGLLGMNSRLQFVLRVSYVKRYSAPVSLRMPVSWFCTKHQ